MSDLGVLGFGPGTADAGLAELRGLGMAAGGLAGAGFGALSGSLADHGISDRCIKNLCPTHFSGAAALFLLIKRATPDKVLPRIVPGRPRGIQTSLAREREDKLRAAPSATPEAAA